MNFKAPSCYVSSFFPCSIIFFERAANPADHSQICLISYEKSALSSNRATTQNKERGSEAAISLALDLRCKVKAALLLYPYCRPI